MNTLQSTKSKGGALALMGAFSLLTAAGHAAFVALPTDPPPTSTALTLTTGLTGTVIRTLDAPFADNAFPPPPFATGILRSFVVDTGSGLDFYYQLVNTSLPPSDFTQDLYRIKTVGGFSGVATSVTYTDSIAGLTAGVGSGFVPGSYTTSGLQVPATADRGQGIPPIAGSIGFEFSNFIGDSLNVEQGESSSFLVIRTNASSSVIGEAGISGAAFSLAAALVAVPEPGTALFGLAIVGACASRNSRRRKQSLEASQPIV